MTDKLHSVPITFKFACEYIAKFHRHNKPPTGMKFCVAVADEENIIRGVVTAGRPVARMLDDGVTLEINRTCTDGCKNANSFLYGVAWRVAKELGYIKALTYTQCDESGISLKAAGWKKVEELKARKSWSESSVKMKNTRDPIGTGGVARVRWEIKR